MAVSLGVACITPAQAATTESVSVVVSGDSYGAGVGANAYQPDTVGDCWRSANGPGEQVVAMLRAQGKNVTVRNVACSGATIADMSKPHPGTGTVQLDAMDSSTNLITLFIGGNDVKFGPVAGLCIQSDCTEALQSAQLLLPTMGVSLVKLFDKIKARSPHARVILFGYGQPVTSGANANVAGLDPICDPSILTSQERSGAAKFAARLDLTLRLAAVTARLRGVDVRFISPFASSWPGSVNLRPEFEGRSLCSTPVPYQAYRGLDALAPPPPSGPGDEAGQTAIFHGEELNYHALAQLAVGSLN